ncbi:MAG: RIP metalloprotease RseP [Kangiellaceae bacterium]|nr:RIP metalloprotease RseP [Kangiellaceae bacterium]
MEVLSNIFYFIIALGILVTFHEWGHFWVARKLGVKVLTFSVGFGKSIWQKTAKDGVCYRIAAIPLGGYVKMLDEREGEVSEKDLDQAFNRKPVWVRFAIVAAGPIANFLLAIFLYWLVFLMGITDRNTIVGAIEPTSIAGQAGLAEKDEIVSVDGEGVILMQDVVESLARRLGEKSNLALEVRKPGYTQTQILKLELSNWTVDSDKPDILGSLGIRHSTEDIIIEPKIREVTEGTPASKSGLMPDDLIKSYQGTKVTNWIDLVELIRRDKNKQVTIEIERNDELKSVSVVIGSHKPDGEEVGFLGVSPYRPQIDADKYYSTRIGGVGESFSLAVDKTAKMITLSAELFKKLLTGDISPKSLSGPIAIAEGAGGTARSGLVYFISFIAMISVNLGFINLLPIPLLDGGHLLFFSIEAIKGKPLSEKVQEMGLQVGVLLVFMMMAIAIFNDISRQF